MRNDDAPPPPGRDPNAIALLKELGLSPGTAGSTQDELTAALLEAIGATDLERVKRLVEHGADVNSRYCSHGIWCMGHEFVTPLMAAAETTGGLEIVRYLLSIGADPTITREKREDVGYDDYKWEGTGEYEGPVDLAEDPEVRSALAAAIEARAES